MVPDSPSPSASAYPDTAVNVSPTVVVPLIVGAAVGRLSVGIGTTSVTAILA